MTKDEFEFFCKNCNEAFPKQMPMNQTEINFMAHAVSQYDLKEVMNALALHVQHSEWRPKVCDITKFLQMSDQSILSTFYKFFERREVEDERAVKIYRQMGGMKLNKLTTTELKQKEVLFLELYKQEEAKEKYESLPKSIKSKLIGVIDDKRNNENKNK